MRKQRRISASRLISVFVFATRIVQFLFYLNPKFQASSSFLCLYRLVCVRPVWKPHCWFFSRGGSNKSTSIRYWKFKQHHEISATTRENWSSGLPTRPDINRPVQSQKRARHLKIWIYKSRRGILQSKLRKQRR